jgi:hypothetical protein
MKIIKRSDIKSVADGFSSKDNTWIAIFEAFSGGIKPDELISLVYFNEPWLEIPEWGNGILKYMFGARDTVSEAMAIEALDEAFRSQDLIQMATSTNTKGRTYVAIGTGPTKVQVSASRMFYSEFLLRLKLDELLTKYGYYLRGGIDIQSMAELLPENLSIGAKVSGLGSTILGQSILGNVKPLTAEAVGTGATSLNDNEKTEDTSMYPLSDWLSDNALYVGIAAIVILGLIYYKWVR